MLGALCVRCPRVLTVALPGRHCHYLLTHEETEAQRGDVTCPKPHSPGAGESGALVSSLAHRCCLPCSRCLAKNVTWDRKLGAACGSRGDGWPAQPRNPLPPRLKGRPYGGWGLHGAQGKRSEAVLLGGLAEGTGLGAWGHQTRSPLHPGAQGSPWKVGPGDWVDPAHHAPPMMPRP